MTALGIPDEPASTLEEEMRKLYFEAVKAATLAADRAAALTGADPYLAAERAGWAVLRGATLDEALQAAEDADPFVTHFTGLADHG